MSRLLVVFGATGNQGGSVIETVLNHPQLSKQYKVRGITRDTSKSAAQKLQSRGVDMVSCNFDDTSSIQTCLHGASYVFAVTTTDYEKGREDEFNQGKAIADAAVAAKAEYIVFSTLPNISKKTNGKLNHAWHFDVKADVEDYIRSLPIKSAFYAPGSFMQNYQGFYTPRKQDDGTYAIAGPEKGDSKHIPLIDITDTGKYVGSILLHPEQHEGKTLYGTAGLYSWNQTVEAINKATGKTVKYMELPESVFKGFLPANMANEICEMLKNTEDYGYYGEKQQEHIDWSNAQALSTPTSFEEFLAKHPLQF